MDSFYRRLEAALAPAYTIERELMGGGMSHVYLATEKALGRSVVVKVLPPELAAGVNRERFRREIHLAAQLQHPHIVPLLTAGEDGDLLYYTMPFVRGESPRAPLEERGPRAGWCTGTSSRATFSLNAVTRSSPTSAWPRRSAPRSRPRAPPRRASPSGLPPTWRPSSSQRIRRRTTGWTSTPWVSLPTSC